MTRNEALKYRAAIEQSAQFLDDKTALSVKCFYPVWEENAAYTAGHKVAYKGKLWRCMMAHTSQAAWEPENAASLWEVINETHSGTVDDPIPYEGNMALTAGLYYVQDYTVYLCNRDTGAPVYNTLAELVGVYVERI